MRIKGHKKNLHSPIVESLPEQEFDSKYISRIVQ